MVLFELTTAGGTAFSNAASNSTTVLIDAIAIYNGGTQIGNDITDFSGNVVKDSGSSFGNYAVVSWTDDSSTAYTITNIKLKSGNTIVAESEAVSVVKPANKVLNMRGVSIHLPEDYAQYIAFNSTTIGLPYATKYRQGVVRMASLDDTTHLANTVFSAADTITKIQSYVSGSELSVPWDKDGSDNPITGETTVSQLSIVDDYDSPTQTATLTVDSSTGSIVTDSTITGTAVESTPHTSTSGGVTTITDTTKLVTGSYIANLYSSSVDTSVGQSDAHKLVSSGAVKSYVEDKLDGTNNDYVHKSGAETITGAKTFTGGIVANSAISGTGVYSTYVAGSGTGGWENADSAAKLPTVGAVKGAIDAGDAAVTTAFQTADTNLQSQIDALNAGQNLADIVNTKTALVNHTLTNLKANGDTIPDSDPVATFTVGDKIQVLHDTTVMSGEHEGDYDDSTDAKIAAGIATVYELRKGTKSSSDKKDVASSTTGYYWHYIGEYGCDSYSKSESDSLFIPKTDIVQSITNGDSTHVPSADAVYDYVDTVTGNFVTLDTAQTITGTKTFSSGETIFANPNDNGASGISINESGNGTSSSIVLNTQYLDNTHWTVAGHSFDRAYGQPNANFMSSLTVFDSQGQHAPIFGTTIRQHNSTHYSLYSSDILLVPDDSLSGMVYPFVEAAHAAGDTTGSGYEENYLERIRIRKNTSTSDSTVHTSYIDLYADNINTVFTSASYRIHSGASDSEILKISAADGVYSTSFTGGYIVNNVSYDFGPAGSLDIDTTITSSADNDHVPTSLAVKNYIADSAEDVLETISTVDAVGSIGLFMYTEVGAEKGIGETVDGAYLRPVGISLPMSGQISYKSATPIPALTGTWTLLSIAMRRTATEPCLVLAQKTEDAGGGGGGGGGGSSDGGEYTTSSFQLA